MNSVTQVRPRTLLALAMVGLLSACSEQAPAPAHSMPPAQVTVLEVKPTTASFTIELPATLTGSKEVQVRSRVAGILESRNFAEGERVQAGQSLFTIDLQPFKLALSLSQADLQGAKARLAQTVREVERLKTLRAEKSVSQRDYDTAVSDYEIAQAQVKSSETRLQEAELNLQYAQVQSPIKGVLGREFVSEGTYVPGPELLLTQITQLDPMLLRFGFSEREQLQMRDDVTTGQLTLPKDGHWKTDIQLQNGRAYPLSGTVNFSDVRINPATGTSEFQAVVPNPDYQLRSGQFVKVILSGAERNNVFVIPQRAVLDNGMGKFVYRYISNEQGQTIASPTPVEVGEWTKFNQDHQAENSWIIRKGLNAGDKVIVDGVARIFFPGMPVQLAATDSAHKE
ncbi:efflux RND transporter periplasmic adaptor subunit [Pseudoalteromonas tunicata]|uniref:Efflux transporter, MFP subunit, AcrA/E family protein n=1 Tax=Pseudoalteromonas tunicata D2 TaxID=87626 RepID=A4CC28_9GAMM|nr:efflux RND transporter periplasmic adaptor subunit [Pseudoalteromonas tunicata]ATC94464.1 membrane fusion protein [Pseudoalteromonas tunicata]AXT30194.1 efflux RND transporter periplasmic adaptor subunit [Pseudoalteromonas tunicata]EAR27915.1 efflux transporter, MFP subunit, AcrA/E family protein [Pseudoalteromonas tunicata D2]MDP4984146.1 efflux RND transporter periplasmic adaptor subunit [Pseudoalteromonas tunicata]MDP5211679.1 efflux RND transporter periplasmic adaptor subunit [Pseudoalt